MLCIMNLPHGLTLLRILCAPLFPCIYLGYEKLGIPFAAVPWILLTVLVVSELSDLLDGSIARRRNQVTDLGKVLDPMADSMMHLSLFLMLTQGVVGLPLMWGLLFLYRELLIGTLRTLSALKGVALAARVSGKLKTFLQAAVSFWILLLLGGYSLEWVSVEELQRWSEWAVALTVVAAWASGFDYLRVYTQSGQN